MVQGVNMLNNREHNNIIVKVLPVGVEAPDYCKGTNLPKSHKKCAPKYAEEIIEEETIIEDETSIEDEIIEFDEVVEDDEVLEKVFDVSTIIQCSNGYIEIAGSLASVNEVLNWLAILGARKTSSIELSGDCFHVFGDMNEGYRYFRGDFMHKEPEKCLGLVEVEPDEDGGRVWRDFADFDDIKVSINLS